MISSNVLPKAILRGSGTRYRRQHALDSQTRLGLQENCPKNATICPTLQWFFTMHEPIVWGVLQCGEPIASGRLDSH